VKLGWTWCYLLKCTGGYLLIDTDYEKYYARFEKKLANLGIAASDIKYLLLTHHHDDHAGFCGRAGSAYRMSSHSSPQCGIGPGGG